MPRHDDAEIHAITAKLLADRMQNMPAPSLSALQEPPRHLWRGVLIMIADDADGWHLRHATDCRPQWRAALDWLHQNGYVERVTPRQWCIEAWQLTPFGRGALLEAAE